MVTQNEIVQLSNDLGISEREARFMLAIESGEIDGDIISGPAYDYVVKERSGTNTPPSPPGVSLEDRAASSSEHSNGSLARPISLLHKNQKLKK